MSITNQTPKKISHAARIARITADGIPTNNSRGRLTPEPDLATDSTFAQDSPEIQPGSSTTDPVKQAMIQTTPTAGVTFSWGFPFTWESHEVDRAKDPPESE